MGVRARRGDSRGGKARRQAASWAMDGGSWVVLGTSNTSCRLAADCREDQAYTRRTRRLRSMLRSWRLAVEAVEAVGGNKLQRRRRRPGWSRAPETREA